MEFINELKVWNALLVVVSLIMVSWAFSVFQSILDKVFDLRKLPQVLATNIFPYVGGLTVLAALAEYISQPYQGMFYLFAVFIGGKYLAEIKDKAADLFGMTQIQGGK